MSQLIITETFGNVRSLARREQGKDDKILCTISETQARGIHASGVYWPDNQNEIKNVDPKPLTLWSSPDVLKGSLPWRLLAGDEEIGRFADHQAEWFSAQGVKYAQLGEPNLLRRAVEEATIKVAQRENELGLAKVLKDKAVQHLRKAQADLYMSNRKTEHKVNEDKNSAWSEFMQEDYGL